MVAAGLVRRNATSRKMCPAARDPAARPGRFRNRGEGPHPMRTGHISKIWRGGTRGRVGSRPLWRREPRRSMWALGALKRFVRMRRPRGAKGKKMRRDEPVKRHRKRASEPSRSACRDLQVVQIARRGRDDLLRLDDVHEGADGENRLAGAWLAVAAGHGKPVLAMRVPPEPQ